MSEQFAANRKYGARHDVSVLSMPPISVAPAPGRIHRGRYHSISGVRLNARGTEL